MLRNILLKTLRDRRRSLRFWSIGLVFVMAIMIAFYPTIRDMPAIGEYIESLPEEMMALFAGEAGDYTTPPGLSHTPATSPRHRAGFRNPIYGTPPGCPRGFL